MMQRYLKFAITVCGVCLISIGIIGCRKTVDHTTASMPMGGAEKELSAASADTLSIDEFSSLEEAESAAGFYIQLPESFSGGYQPQSNRVICADSHPKVLEIMYANGRNTLTITKTPDAADKEDKDKAAQSETVSENEIVKMVHYDDRNYQLSGQAEQYHLAKWSSDGFTYSIYSTNAVTQDEMLIYFAALVH